MPQPDDVTCRRYFEQNDNRFRAGERVSLRHILFAVTPGSMSPSCGGVLKLPCLMHGAGPTTAKTDSRHSRELSNCRPVQKAACLAGCRRRTVPPEFAGEVFEQRKLGVAPARAQPLWPSRR